MDGEDVAVHKVPFKMVDLIVEDPLAARLQGPGAALPDPGGRPAGQIPRVIQVHIFVKKGISVSGYGILTSKKRISVSGYGILTSQKNISAFR